LGREGKEDIYEIKRELRSGMDQYVGVNRTGEDLSKALDVIKKLQVRYNDIKITDKSHTYNTNLVQALELGYLLDLAEVMVTGALTRTESRGAHARRDHPKRDDVNWLKHTLAFRQKEGPKLDYKSVNITMWKPVERKY